jgi:dolichyl-phosphate-mannose--protein O-mannosyl transferase
MTRSRANINRDWATALGFGALGLLLRLWNLASPKGFIFDEVYYAKNANSLLLHGVELDPKTKAAEFIVHPPIGKWLISIGVKIFGFNEFGWRISAATIGALSIIIMYFTARKLFENYFLSIAAALLISIDGLHLVMSRVALLDIFLTFFIQCAILAILYRKYWVAAIALGFAISTKWSGLYFLVAFVALILVMDYSHKRYLGFEKPIFEVIRKDLPKRVVQFGVMPILIYTASWTGWLLTKSGWDRNWSKNVWRNLWHYHAEILTFHTHLFARHSYSANPWSWLILGRPTSFFYANPKNCGAPRCAQEIIALGTPILWWSALAALFVTFGYWVSQRDRISGILLTAIAAGYLPWFTFQKRTMFYFYTISFEPFFLLTLVYVLGKYLSFAKDEGDLRNRKKISAGIALIFILNFLYFLPLYLGIPTSEKTWNNHMWFLSWI